MAKKDDKQKFGDIIENHNLIKRTLMVAAFPALIKSAQKDGEQSFEGFLPGFEFAQIEDIASILKYHGFDAAFEQYNRIKTQINSGFSG